MLNDTFIFKRSNLYCRIISDSDRNTESILNWNSSRNNQNWIPLIIPKLSIKIAGPGTTTMFKFVMFLLTLFLARLILKASKKCKVKDYTKALSILRNTVKFSRAEANKCLKKAFNVSNPFFTDDESYRKIFNRAIIEQIHTVCSESFESSMRVQISISMKENDGNLVTFVNHAVMRSFLALFCSSDGGCHLSGTEIRELSTLIAQTWVSAKCGETCIPSKLVELSDKIIAGGIDAQLVHIIDGNVLNLILPGHDTLWRLVFFTIISIFKDKEQLSKVWCEFMDGKDVRKHTEFPKTMSVINATLHQFPPVRSIYRGSGSSQMIIDVVTIQRSSAQPKLLTFSAGPRHCPAASKYVPLFTIVFLKCFMEIVNDSGMESVLVDEVASYGERMETLYRMNRVEQLKEFIAFSTCD